jgi:ankyrin repeat protein
LPLLVPVLLGGCATALREQVGAAATTALARLDPYDPDTGLYAAARAGDALRVRLVLAGHPGLLDEPERYTKLPLTPLQIAADRNHLAVMKVLIGRGADLEAGSDSGWGSPLRIAAREGHREAAELLLEHGAVLDVFSAVALDKRDRVERALRAAAAFGVADWVANARVMEFGRHDTPLVRVAADRGHREMVALLVRYGADPGAGVISEPSFINDNRFEGVTSGVTPAGELVPR